MNKNYLIGNLIAKILEFAFIIVTIINLNTISHHLCCDMESAVILIMVLFGLLEICILSQIIDDIICLVKIKKGLKAKFKGKKALPFDKKSFQDFAWEEIKEIDRLGIADKYFKIKQTRDDYLKFTNKKITTMIINLKPLVLTFKVDGNFEINPTYEDKNGKRIYWETSKMRNVYMKRIFASLPNDMQKVIAETEIKTDLGSCKDKLWLFSKEEIKKGKFDFFKNNSWKDFGDNRWSWTRSANPYYASGFYNINSSGSTTTTSVDNPNGVRLGFRINTPTSANE